MSESHLILFADEEVFFTTIIYDKEVPVAPEEMPSWSIKCTLLKNSIRFIIFGPFLCNFNRQNFNDGGEKYDDDDEKYDGDKDDDNDDKDDDDDAMRWEIEDKERFSSLAARFASK